MDVLKDILDSLNDSVIIIDPYGQIVFYNQEALHTHKSISSKAVQIGDQIPDVVAAEYKKAITDILSLVRAKKKPHEAFAECVTHAGTKVFLELKFVPVLDTHGKIKFINIITVDITARKLMESRTRAMAMEASATMENAHAFVVGIDARGYIVAWNNHCTRITGFQKSEIYCNRFADLLQKSDETAWADAMSTIFRNQPISEFEVAFRTKAGRYATIKMSASPRTNPQGQVIGATLIGQDITEIIAYSNLQIARRKDNEGARPQNKKPFKALPGKNRYALPDYRINTRFISSFFTKEKKREPVKDAPFLRYAKIVFESLRKIFQHDRTQGKGTMLQPNVPRTKTI
jgi:PAS domain S-box-containing protein